jgi:hypothetical protein
LKLFTHVAGQYSIAGASFHCELRARRQHGGSSWSAGVGRVVGNSNIGCKVALGSIKCKGRPAD